jgi:hypothetical protein
LRGIYIPQPPNNRWGGADVDGRTGPLEALSSSGTGQSGAAPDMHRSVSGAPLTGGSDSARTVLHCSSDFPAFAVNRCAKEPLLPWCTEQSDGIPDSPVNYSGACWLKPEGGETRAHSVSCSF